MTDHNVDINKMAPGTLRDQLDAISPEPHPMRDNFLEAALYQAWRAGKLIPADEVLALLAERDDLRAKLDAAVDASEKMITVRNRYEATPSDRGGAWGPKGRANNNWRIAFAELAATIAKIKGADK